MEYTSTNSLRNAHAESGGSSSSQTRIHGHNSIGEFTFQSIPSRNPWCDLKKNLFSIDSTATQANAQCVEYSHTKSHVGRILCKVCTDVRNQSARFSQTKVFNPIVLQTSSCAMTMHERPETNGRTEKKNPTEGDTERKDVTNNLRATCSIQESSRLDDAMDTTSIITGKGKSNDQKEIYPMNSSPLFENRHREVLGKSRDHECLSSFSLFFSFNEACHGSKGRSLSNVGRGKGQDNYRVEQSHQGLTSLQGNLNLLSSFVNSEDETDKNLSDSEWAVHSSGAGNGHCYAFDKKYLNFPSKESSSKNSRSDNSSSNCKDDNKSEVDNYNTNNSSGNNSSNNYADNIRSRENDYENTVNALNDSSCNTFSCNDGYIDIKQMPTQSTSCDSEGSVAIERKSNTTHNTREDHSFNVRNEKAKTTGRNFESDKQGHLGVSSDPKLDSLSFSPTEFCTETFSTPKSAFRRVNTSVFYPASARLASYQCISQTGQTVLFPLDRGCLSDFPGFRLSDMCNLYESNSLPNIPVSAGNNTMEFFDPHCRPVLSQNHCRYNTFYPYSVEKLWQNNHLYLNSGVEGNNYSIAPHDQMIRRLKEEIPVHTSMSKSKIMMYRCGLCGFTCSSGSQLKSHGRIHSGRDGKLFKCECGRAFARNEELTRHRRIHSDYKPHQCHVCKKAFGRKDHLGKHLVTHLDTSQKKVHKCTVCGCEQRYTRSDALARHQWAAHGIKARPAKCGAQK